MSLLNLNMIGRVLGLALLLTTACSAITPEDPAATLRAQREGFIDEATSIAQALDVQREQIQATAEFAEAYMVQADNRNQMLLATLRVALPPTPQALGFGDNNPDSFVERWNATPEAFAAGADAAPEGAGAFPVDAPNGAGSTIDGMTFTQVETALTVRDADGCADTITRAFAADVRRIYVTTRALNIRAGTVMSVQWSYQTQPDFSESFTVSTSSSDFCLWFFIEPTDANFGSGSWSVQMSADGQPINPSISFTVGAESPAPLADEMDEMDDMGG